MFLRRRRPLVAAAMLGGTAYVAHKAGQQQAMAAQREAGEEARLDELETPQAPAAAPQEQPAPQPQGGGPDVVSKLQELTQLRDQGALSPDEFEAAKKKLLAD
jgi:putative oligomerization/nucleic acid binding protein